MLLLCRSTSGRAQLQQWAFSAQNRKLPPSTARQEEEKDNMPTQKAVWNGKSAFSLEFIVA